MFGAGDVNISVVNIAVESDHYSDSSAVAALFDRFKKFLGEYEIQAVLSLLESLRSAYGHRLTAYQWYRWYASRGHAFRLAGRLDEAAASYLSAADKVPQSEEAKSC